MFEHIDQWSCRSVRLRPLAERDFWVVFSPHGRGGRTFLQSADHGQGGAVKDFTASESKHSLRGNQLSSK